MINSIVLKAFIPIIIPVMLYISYPGGNASKIKSVSHLDTTILKIGDKVPDIIFRDTCGFKGNDRKLSELKGKYVLIDVWASWCYPCRVQQPYLVALEKKMKNKAITFLSISIDTQLWKWKGPLLNKLAGLQWMVRDKSFEKAFAINTIPRFILLDKTGRVLSLNATMPSHSELEQELNSLKGI
ncbi:TlpA family protein disulfide reductase [Pedobacter ginsenosidimutans]|uniref:TlpA family protein disulfide reductase n=1 Tax=Pedobacter ginsenosidimutans TaxID=687842 RepID=UPI0009F89458|nr:TlpA disulfide reductase family protein [Pedobacter ginsenosidimutans]